MRESKICEKLDLLIVDDVKDNLLALSALLERDDLKIHQALSGTEALDLMVKNDFCLAMVDIQMPGMNGFELAELMRGANKTKNIPIIFVTATATGQSFLLKGYESGAVDFLQKPLDSHAVKSKVNVFIELHRQKINLKRVQAQLELAVQTRDDFVSIASHELKTPLTALILNAQVRKRIIKKGDLAAFSLEKLSDMFDADERQLVKITHLIDDMLDISRISSGKLSITLERFDLCALVRELLDRCKQLFLASGCEVEAEFCEPLFGCWDRFRIEQVVTNLLTNAMRYGAGKPISVQVTCTSDKAMIAVHDKGRGIAPENQVRIFQRFERAISSAEISGLGLGLYIVSQILEAHRGSIQVKSKLGHGATFIVELPLLEGAKDLHSAIKTDPHHRKLKTVI